MTDALSSELIPVTADADWHFLDQEELIRGEILLKTQSHSAWGAAVTAWMYLPVGRSQAWQGLTDYPRWVQYFPDLIRSEVLSNKDAQVPAFRVATGSKRKQLYQVARKAFLFFTAQVEIYLSVFETLHRQIQFRLESGSFSDFSAELKLQDCGNGTLLMYTVRATPLIPVPSVFIQQAIQLDLPANLRRMRQVLCSI
ncbi:cyclase [Leptolyngbya sp. 'hensonii']|uniref:SRPBCC family protein n=1 Tax=Leptolyngbya sp. 'hensonii' TaxID=1922337 RepID=UPI0009502185|nr:SRPBCC family protein [Leptolyngbya sp. 'hensonii']OLP17736.1 cyclase [Leptolyngbya sp. 'hensonii']